MKRIALSGALALALSSPAPADEAIRATIPCAVGLLCEVSFSPGEVLGDWFASDAKRWSPSTAVSGTGSSAAPQLILEPTAPGLRANFIAFSRVSNRSYQLSLVSTSDSTPTYAHVAFARPTRRAAPKPVATPAPTVSDLMASACKTQTDGYTVDAAPLTLRPVSVCHDFGHTYISLPGAATAVTDIPAPYEDLQSGPTRANFTFDERERTFTIDSVADLELRYAGGRKSLVIRIRRRPAPAPSKPVAVAPAHQPSVDQTLAALFEVPNVR